MSIRIKPKPDTPPEEADLSLDEPDISHLEMEDGEPVDNIFSEKQQRLLAESLRASWNPGRDFAVFANVGLFYDIKQPPVVPDVMLSMDVRVHPRVREKKHSSYLLWVFKKPPELVIEIVSNKKGGEADKKRIYAQAGVRYYVILDPERRIQSRTLEVYENREGSFVSIPSDAPLPGLGLSFCLKSGKYDGMPDTWLRWRDADGQLILTGAERAEKADRRAKKVAQRAQQAEDRAEQEKQRAEQERQRAELEKQRADQEKQRAEQERQRAERLAAKLRALGIDEDSL